MAVIINGTTGITTPADTIATGNLTFSATGQRITGDFSNATFANRVMFQTSTANGTSAVSVLPNGTSLLSQFQAFSTSDPANASRAIVNIDGANSIMAVVSDKTGTGSYQPMAFYTGGSERMRVDTSGNLGVGTASPSSLGKFVVLTAQADTTDLAVFQRFSTGTFRIRVPSSGLSTIGTQYADNLGFETNATERMRIDTSGNVGVGTSFPSSYGKLSVYGSGQVLIATADGTVQNNVSYLNAGVAYTGTVTAHPLAFTTSNTERIRIDTTGRLISALAGVATIAYTFGGQETTSGIGLPASGTLSFYAGSATERMRLDSSGNLILGSTAVAVSGTRLSVVGTTVAGVGTMSSYNGGANTKPWSFGPDGNGNFVIYNGSSVGMYIAYGNNSWTASSDERLKTKLTPFADAAKKVASLRAGTGRYLADDKVVSRSFLIAQDVQKVLPEAVNTLPDEQGTLGLSYTDVIPLLVAAIQELEARVKQLEAK